MFDDDEKAKRMTVWLESQRMDHVRRYSLAGRSLGSLSTDDVKARWMDGINQWARDTDRPRPSVIDEGEAELIIRGEELPYQEVPQALDAIKAAARARGRELLTDPEKAAAAGKDILNSMDALDAEAKRSKN